MKSKKQSEKVKSGVHLPNENQKAKQQSEKWRSSRG